MANKIILFTGTIDKFIEPQYEPYRLLHGGPRRIGDIDEINTATRTRVKVMLCEVKGCKRSLWLVEVP